MEDEPDVGCRQVQDLANLLVAHPVLELQANHQVGVVAVREVQLHVHVADRQVLVDGQRSDPRPEVGDRRVG